MPKLSQLVKLDKIKGESNED